MPRDLFKMFFPNSIAVIGASPDLNKHNGAVLSRTIKSGFFKIYPINPKYKNIFGYDCYPSVKNLPLVPDVAFIMVPAKFVLNVIQECADKEIENIVLLTAGFKETGKEGADLEEKIVQLVNQHKINLLGPNCPGFISSKLHFCMAEDYIKPGKTILITQSGGMNAALADFANQLSIGCRLLIGIGNKAQMDEVDILESLCNDAKLLGDAKVIALYLEGLDRPKDFLDITKKFKKMGIPIVVFKAGKSKLAQKAAYSHTGAIATPETALNALLEKANVIRVNDVQDFLMTVLSLNQLPCFETRKVAVLSNSGGVGVMTTDALEQKEFGLTEFSAKTRTQLRAILEKHGVWQTSTNPIDLVGGGTPDIFYETTKLLLERPEVEVLVVSFVKPPLPNYQKEVAEVLARAHREFPAKPMIVVNLTDLNAELRNIYHRDNLPVFSTPESATVVLEIIGKIKRSLDKKLGHQRKFEVNKNIAALMLNKDLPKRALQAYGLQTPKTVLTTTMTDFIQQCKKFAEQGIKKVALKIESPDIIHKSEIGGVVTGLELEKISHITLEMFINQVKTGAPNAKINGVWIEEMINGGHEILIGVKREPEFGHLISFGEGGIYTEFRKDVSFALAPLTVAETWQMIRNTRFYKILSGVRGQPPVNFQAIIGALLKISQLVTDFPQIEELDINPAKVNETELICLDARIKINNTP